MEPTSQVGALDAKDSEGLTALMIASKRGMVTLMQKLVDKGADCGITARDGSTISEWLLLAAGVDANTKNGVSPSIWAHMHTHGCMCSLSLCLCLCLSLSLRHGHPCMHVRGVRCVCVCVLAT